jgi:hypothetical protein
VTPDEAGALGPADPLGPVGTVGTVGAVEGPATGKRLTPDRPAPVAPEAPAAPDGTVDLDVGIGFSLEWCGDRLFTGHRGRGGSGEAS